MQQTTGPANVDFITDGGDTGKLIQSINWSGTSLGPMNTWPQSLRTSINTALKTRFPILIWWGNELTLIYNDAYIPIFAGKHPNAMGKPGLSLYGWGEEEVKVVIEPMLRGVMQTGEPTWSEDQLLILERKGFREETYFTWSYSPIVVESGKVGGVLTIVTETTERVISQRRMNILRDLGEKVFEAKNLNDAYANVISVLDEHPFDLPFFLLYFIETDSNVLNLVGKSGRHIDEDLCPTTITLDDKDVKWPLSKVFKSGKEELVIDLQNQIGNIPGGYWPEFCDLAFLTPIVGAGQKQPYGVLVSGISPRREFDHNYKSFLKLMTDQIATAISNVHTIEEERKRAEALAEIDRAKTAFFSNISHEFRTPLTLMISPLEELMEADSNLNNQQKENLRTSYRNTRRLQKLVNTLLDFSRIEAGRMDAQYQLVDVGKLTTDLASTFRSAIENGGIEYNVHIPHEPTRAYVDVDMWEKIVLNLISNAFKYTTEGYIKVIVSTHNDHVLLQVVDSGVGIAERDKQKIFDRFYRVSNALGRSQEGTGIGLSMVKELVQLHHGEISVESEAGKGSTFSVRIPTGSRHISSSNIISAERRHKTQDAFVEEASKWSAHRSFVAESLQASDESKIRGKILLADDNSDMREYIQRLLQNDFHVYTTTNGEDAFSLALEIQPDLIISDIMMPKLDGLGLLKRLKSNLTTSSIPVIFLSARAGEEAKVEGINAGADDYLVKPFSAKELIARVNNHIAINKTRRATERGFFELFKQSPAHIHAFKGPDHVVEFFHPLAIPFIGKDLTGQKLREALPEYEGMGYFERYDRVYNEGVTLHFNENKATFLDANGEPKDHYFNTTYFPWKDTNGSVQGVLQFSFEVTEQVKAKRKIEESEERLRIANDIVELGTWEYDPINDIVYASSKTIELFGLKSEGLIRLDDVLSTIVADDRKRVIEAVNWAFDPRSKGKYDLEYFIKNLANKELRIIRANGKVFFDSDNKPYRFIGTALDITERKKTEKELRASEERFRLLCTSIPQIVWTTNEAGVLDYLSDQWELYTGQSAAEGLQAFSKFVHPDDYVIIAQAWEKSIKQGTSWQAEYRIKNNNTGEYRWFAGTIVPLKDEEGKVIKWIGSASDIQNLKDQSSWLEQQVIERTKELEELNQSLQRSNNELQQFAYISSHDLQEPLRKIQTFAEMARDNFKDANYVKQYLEKIDKSASRMSTLIKDVLVYSQASKEEKIFVDVNLQETLKETLNDFELLIEQKRAVIKNNALPVVRGNKLQFHQLFSNMLNNSLKFTKENPTITITWRVVKGEEIKTDGNTIKNKNYNLLLFTDNGIGFEQVYADQIFGLFNRLHNRMEYAGTGIGLALCKKIVENHNGFIKAISSPGAGATFEVYLPIDN